jgi:hypothetical protein
MRILQLKGEAARVGIEHERKRAEFAKQEAESRKEIQNILASGKEEAALGVIAEKEAEINRLLRERKNQRDELAKKPTITAEGLADFDLTTKLLLLKKQFGEDAKQWAQEITRQLADALTTAIFDPSSQKKFSDIFMNFGKWLGGILIKEALKPLEQALTDLFVWLRQALSEVFGGWFGGGSLLNTAQVTTNAHGGVFLHGVRLTAFGRGGIVTKPTIFAMANGLGLMGEAGYEAVMPLTRIGGDLGVKALIPQPVMNVVINNNTPAQVETSQTSSGDLLVTIDDMMAQATARHGSFVRALSTVGRVITR